MPPFAVALSLKFPKSHPDRSLSAPWLKSLVLALAARNNITEKGREKESPSAAKHINLQIYLVVIIPEGETYSILHHLRNCPHLFGDSNRRSGACASSSSEATCCCCPPSRSPILLPNPLSKPVPSEMFLDISLLRGNLLCFGASSPRPLKSWWGNIPGQPGTARSSRRNPWTAERPPQGPAGQRHVFRARCRVGCSSLGCWPCLLKKSSVTICAWPATWECRGGRSTWLL